MVTLRALVVIAFRNRLPSSLVQHRVTRYIICMHIERPDQLTGRNGVREEGGTGIGTSDEGDEEEWQDALEHFGAESS